MNPRSEKFFAASEWKKATNKAEQTTQEWEEVKPDIALPGALKSIRGRVVDSVSGKPVAGASIRLESKPDYEARGMTDTKGAFSLDEIRNQD